MRTRQPASPSRRAVIASLGAMAAGAALTARGAGAAPPSAGRFERHAQFTSRHVAARDVVVWLPPGYDATQPHAVLYMQDGQNLFDPNSGMGHGPWAVDTHLAALIAAGRTTPTIVVGIDNSGTGRWRDYAPAVAVAALPERLRVRVEDTGGGAPVSDGYVRFLVEELKPFIDAHYRTRPDRADTLVMGSSMGGLISLYALCRHPQVFGAAGCLSTHWPLTVRPDILQGPAEDIAACAAPFIEWLSANLPRAGDHRLYFDHGTARLDGLYAPFQERVDVLLGTLGYRRGVDLDSRVYAGADHNEAAWRERLDVPLSFLLGR
jgi:enterochelin esterase-like enzyme